MIVGHEISKYCSGEICHCGEFATHKIGEELQQQDIFSARHNYTAYVCCEHFNFAVRHYLKRDKNSICVLPEIFTKDEQNANT